ncbi:MAG: hypothetical protein GWN93_19420 [Deltaproteobacteria bacterium]|nr:hypothetical protein [Deltaproteobacteria bacterium]
MTEPKAITLAQKYGLRDDDLKKADHDKIMIWLDQWLDSDGFKRWIGYPEDWPEERKEELQSDWKAAGRDLPPHERAKPCPNFPPLPPFKIVKKVWEFPITSGKYVIGFADLVIEIPDPDMDFDKDKIRAYTGRRLVLFEVKTQIPSLGDVIRQIRFYQNFTKKRTKPPVWVLVAPHFEDQQIVILAEQGILTLKYPGLFERLVEEEDRRRVEKEKEALAEKLKKHGKEAKP